MNKLQGNLKALLDRDKARFRSENALSEASGVPQPTINRILAGISREPRDSTVAKLGAVWGLSVDVLKRGDALNPNAPIAVPVRAYDVEAVESSEGFDPETETWVEAVEIEVSAGNGRVVPEFVPTRTKQRYTLKWFREMGAKPDRVKIAAVTGDSMEPLLFSKDRIAFDLDKTRIVSGRVYVVVVGFEDKVKRLFRQADGTIRIVSDNPDKTRYPDETVTEDTPGFLVIGQVIERKGSGGL